jgi:lambda family phage portal protein
LRDRIRQARGLSIFRRVITRLEDVKDYEESERIAAKVAASMAAAIKKGSPDIYEPATTTGEPRELRLRPGMIFDDLLPGESIETIDSKRPNPELSNFRNGQLRAVAAGIGVSYSSLARDYNGTYSAQRQELVEQAPAYKILSDQFVSQFIQPVWEAFVTLAVTARLVKIPAELDRRTLTDAEFRAPAMPWIDPLKEANANAQLMAGHTASPQQMIRDRGDNPIDVLNQIAQWRRLLAERGIPDVTPEPTLKPTQTETVVPE